MRFLVVVIVFALLQGCAQKRNVATPAHLETSTEKKQHTQLEELNQIPQDVDVYLHSFHKGKIATTGEFAQHYFRAWNLQKPSVDVEEAKWAYTTYDVNNSFDYTYKPMPQQFFDTINAQSNFDAYGSVNLYAVTTNTTSLRSMPTDKPLFLDPSQAGEGYPFDYMQNSLIAANKPLLISHYSQDKKWVFVESSFGFGWLHAGDVVVIPKPYTQEWQEAKQIFFLQDGVGLYDENGNYLFDSRVGMVLPLIQERKNDYIVLSVTRDGKGNAFYHRTKVAKTIASLGTLEFNDANVAKVLREVQKSQYGWGGLYEQRDCSSTLRDFFNPFGVWLPRNSSMQAKMGKVEQLAGFSNDAKLRRIQKIAMPFQTLVYKKGHIGLYVGNYEGKPIIFQNVWGVKTKDGEKEGRFVVAKPVFSTLELGSELPNFDANASMLSNLQSINTLF